MKKIFLGAVVFFILAGISTGAVSAYVAASSNYRLEKDSLNFGGTDFSTSANFKLNDTLGEIISGITNGTSNNASSGYRYMEPDVVATGTPSAVLGCTDPKANNYKSIATKDDGSCTYPPGGGGGGGGTAGCNNSEAINYNSTATTDDGSCLYGIPNVNLTAHYIKARKAIQLTWQNPANFVFDSIIIIKFEGSFNGSVLPTAEQDSAIIYDGSGQETWDEEVEAGATYSYVALVIKNDDHSSGAWATERVPVPEILGCTDPTAPNYNPDATVNDGSCPADVLGCLDQDAANYNPKANKDDGNCEYSPFATTTEEVFTTLSPEWDFRFLQTQEPTKTFDSQMRVWINGNKNLSILFNYKLAPATLKTIGVTLTDPIDKTKTFSFLMHQNKEGTAYEATIAPLIRHGTYPLDFYIVNYDNQATKRIKGHLIVSGMGPIATIALPVAATGLAISFLPSLYDLLIILFRIFSYFFGRRKNENPWGTVYDSVTKQPLDPVYLTVDQNGKEMSTAITDIDGRFSFFLPAGAYTIKANKTHYRFPSERLAGKTNDELYDHLYFGGKFSTNGEAIINLNLPLDPLDFDWNEFAKTKTNFFAFYTRRHLWFNRLYKLVFTAGFFLSIYAFLLSPSWWNVAILALYLGLLALNRFWRNRQKPLSIINSSTGEPLSFAIIRVFLPDLNQQIKYVVADKLGRFYLLVRPGVYYYTVEEKQPDGSYRKIFQSQPVNLPKGVLTTDIRI